MEKTLIRVCSWCEAERAIVRLPNQEVSDGICLRHLQELMGDQPELDPVTERALKALEGEVWNA